MIAQIKRLSFFSVWHRRYLCLDARRAGGSSLCRAQLILSALHEHCLALQQVLAVSLPGISSTAAGLLHHSLPLRCLPLRHYNCPGERNCGQHYHKEKGAGQHSGDFPCNSPQVSVYLADGTKLQHQYLALILAVVFKNE